MEHNETGLKHRFDTKYMYDQKEPFSITFDNCCISQSTAERVAQVITSIMSPSFREEIPTQRYITGTVTICDGYVSHDITFHSTGFTIHKSHSKEKTCKYVCF